MPKEMSCIFPILKIIITTVYIIIIDGNSQEVKFVKIFP